VLVEFGDPVAAVEWAQNVQEEMSRRSAEAAGTGRKTISFRIGIHLGEVIDTGDDLYGDGVNLAARLQEQAMPGAVVLSEKAYEAVRGSKPLNARDLGQLRLKNLGRLARAYELPTTLQLLQLPTPRDDNIPSIAVLPLMDLTAAGKTQFLSDGLVEDIALSLANLHELFVVSRASTLAFDPRTTDITAVGNALGVRYITTGSLRDSERKIRINFRLWDTQTGTSLWGHSAAVRHDDVFELQENLVERIVAGIAPSVRSAELKACLRKRPENYTAYQNTLKALSLIHSLDRSSFLEAEPYLDRAISIDPNFAMPVAWAARWHSLRIGQGWSTDPSRDAAKAFELASRAVGLDPQNALALAILGHLTSYLRHDFDSALSYLDRALEVCPNSALAWILSGATLSYIGEGARAVRHSERAISLSPFDPGLFYFHMFLALAYYSIGEYEAALKWSKLAVCENPSYLSSLKVLVATLAALKKSDEAAAVALKMMEVSPDFRLGEFEKTLQPFRPEEIKKRYIAHLRSAGLPI
jgi:adenylate cyclase